MSTVTQGPDSLQGAIPPSMVHKHKAENVWLRRAQVHEDGSLHVEYQHPPETAEGRIADLIEVQRQAGIYYVHSQLHVPEGMVFVLSSISLERVAQTCNQRPPSVPSSGSVVVQAEKSIADAPRASETALTFRMLSSSETAAGAATVRVLSRRVYERMRSYQPGASACNVPREARQSNVSAEPYEGTIDVDLQSPLLSDHASDHISAMSVIVAIERSLFERGAVRVDTLSANFHAYLGLNEKATYYLHLGPDGAFNGSVEQTTMHCVTFSGQASLLDEMVSR